MEASGSGAIRRRSRHEQARFDDRVSSRAHAAPLLVVRNAARAIDFYVNVLGAIELARFTNARNGAISHADLKIGASEFSVTEEARAFGADAPPSLGGSPVTLQLRVEDLSATLAALEAAGATILIPPLELCGDRMARVRDPFGHVWIPSQRIETLSREEIQRRRDAFSAALDAARPPKT